jgi:hypothetical protein
MSSTSPATSRRTSARLSSRSSRSRINALYAKLAEEGRRDGVTGLSPRTIHHVHTCLHKACKDAVRWGRIAKNPVDAADPPTMKGEGSHKMKTWDAG